MQGLASAGQCHVQGHFAFAYGAWRGVRDHLIEFEILKKVTRRDFVAMRCISHGFLPRC